MRRLLSKLFLATFLLVLFSGVNLSAMRRLTDLMEKEKHLVGEKKPINERLDKITKRLAEISKEFSTRKLKRAEFRILQLEQGRLNNEKADWISKKRSLNKEITKVVSEIKKLENTDLVSLVHTKIALSAQLKSIEYRLKEISKAFQTRRLSIRERDGFFEEQKKLNEYKFNLWAEMDYLNAKIREIKNVEKEGEKKIERKKEKKEEKEEGNCVICLEPLSERMMIKLRCGHVFHRRCIDQLKKSGGPTSHKCPVCRALL